MVRASIVVATYNRPGPLRRLLASLARQTMPRTDFEVVVVDDGSEADPSSVTRPFAPVLEVTLLRQENRGVAVARQHGVERAKGGVVVFLDDDMLANDDFVERHLAHHARRYEEDVVVMGALLPDARLAEMPLFERYHAHQLERAADRHSALGTFGGSDVYTGNLSLSRELFLRVGGFDPTFHVEDVELGVRLEKAGANFVFARDVATVHASDHTSLESWLARSVKDGRDWVRLMRKHPDTPTANPWRFFDMANPLSRPFFAAAVALPRATPALSRLVFRSAQGAARLGLGGTTLSAMTLLYGIQYFGGVRAETGSLRAAVDAYRAYRRDAWD